jgi:hypothetical protein
LFLFAFAAIDDKAHAWDSDRGLGNVCCYDDLPSSRRGTLKDALLSGLGQGGEERVDEQFRYGPEIQCLGVLLAQCFQVFDRLLPCQKYEYIAWEGFMDVNMEDCL